MHSAAILAGGRARRFGGRDKGALVVNGRTIRERQIAVLEHVADEVLVIDADRDVVPGCGPLGGIYTALLHAAHDTVFVAACDMPFLDRAFVQHLLALAADADAVVPRTERGYHPLCAAYTRGCVDAIAKRLADRRLKTIGIMDDVRVRIVDAAEIARFGEPERLLANVNSADDYARLEVLQGHEL